MGKTRDTGFLTNGLWQDASNNIGIGGSPSGSYKFEVTGTARVSGLLTGANATFGSTGTGNNIIALSNNDQSNTRLRITNTGSGGQTFSIVGGNPGASNAGLAIFDETNSATRLYVGSSGNVGIGTSSPGYLLDVNGTGRFNGKITSTVGNNNLILENTSATTGWIQPLRILNTGGHLGLWVEDSSGNNRASGSSAYAGGLCTYTSTALQFGTNNAIRMSITSDGNIGLATTSPAALLTIKGRGGADIIFQMNDESNVRRCFYIPNQYYGYMWAVGVVSNGGKAFSLGNASGTEVGTIVINAGGVAYNTTSDYRLKEDFKDFNGLDKVSKIKVYDFKWKNLDERIDGVIAHELAEVLPYAVSGVKDALNHEGNIEAQSVDYSKLTPVLVKAIQELSAKVSALENKS